MGVKVLDIDKGDLNSGGDGQGEGVPASMKAYRCGGCARGDGVNQMDDLRRAATPPTGDAVGMIYDSKRCGDRMKVSAI